MEVSEKEQLSEEIRVLESKLTGDMFADMEIREQIHHLKMKKEGVVPDRKEANTLYCNC